MTSTPKQIVSEARYAPPWVDLSIIGIAGSSGSGKSSIARSIVSQLNLPWVVIVSMVRYGGAPFFLRIFAVAREVLTHLAGLIL